MALPTESVCQDMLGQFDSSMSMVGMAERGLKGELRGVSSMLSNATYAPLSNVQNASNLAMSQMGNVIPVFNNTTFDEMLNVINSCSSLAGKNPLDLLNQMTGSLLASADNLIGDLFSSIPQLDVGNALSGLLDKFGVDGLNFTEMIPSMDGILNCLSSVCGSDVSSRIDSMNDITGRLKIKDSGDFDMDSVMGDVGLGANEMQGLTEITNVKQSFKANIKSSVSSGQELFKGLL